MDKYLIVVLIFLIAGMGIGITRGELVLFYTMLAGAIGIILYSSFKSRKEQKELRRQRRKSKK